ncbi:hypothetical protein Sspor_14370 [Streptomyces spororaveus]|uniref:Uncharacterized protein n=1 Tax=Streptomyces spororaveus TaxID=284039 RepID=A0ABQ3T671_9ACTN|nr:hypothetical protein Sspor_14370 [Streptomyces spororaveus]
MDPDDVMIDALADKILGGKVGGALHLPFRRKQKNAPRRAYSPIHVEANTLSAPISPAASTSASE